MRLGVLLERFLIPLLLYIHNRSVIKNIWILRYFQNKKKEPPVNKVYLIIVNTMIKIVCIVKSFQQIINLGSQ